MMKKIKAAGIGLLIVSFAVLLALIMGTVPEQTFSFPSSYKGAAVTLQATLTEKKGAEYAVLICPGYSCDRQKWRPMAALAAENGFTVMTFDYSGQGASAGTIGFDNAKTDNIPQQISDAIAALTVRTGIPEERIILLGHSMGGRSILRLLDDYNNPAAVTQVQKQRIGNVILISPEVNYHFNAQASLFAGTSDDAEEPWHSYNAACIAGTNVYLYGSTADDIVSDEDILAIYAHLGGRDVPAAGVYEAAQSNEVGSRITVGVTSGVLHSYQMYSPKFAACVNAALTEISGAPARFPAWKLRLVYLGWFTGLVGLALVLAALNAAENWTAQDAVPVLTDAGAFLRRKLLFWLPGAVIAFLLCCLCVVMPFGSPVMNTPYMCFIAGYGLWMLWAYRKGRFKGTRGRLPRPTLRLTGDKAGMLRGLLTAAGLCFFLWFALRATMYRLLPLNWRLFWVLFATVLMAVGYYVSGCESDMLRAAGASRAVRLAYSLIQYVPLFLLVGFYLVLKSYSGMIGQIQNMILMYTFCIPLGDFIKCRTRNRLLGAAVTAFLFQTLMITSSALIALF